MHILAISGSLRANSANTNLLRSAITLAEQENITLTLFEGLGELPHFNPDLDGDEPPAAVRAFRAQLKVTDGVLICTPEYAFGVPGVLKNALDWLVSSGEFVHKPTAVISASPLATGGETAHASLLLTLKMMTAAVVEGGTLIVPFISKKLDTAGRLTDATTIEALRSLLRAFMR